MDDIPPPEKQATTIPWGVVLWIHHSSATWGRFRSKLALRVITTSRGAKLWKGQHRIFCRELCRRQKISGICFLQVIFLNKNPPWDMTCVICFKSVFLVSHCVFFSFSTTKTHLLIAQCSSLFSFHAGVPSFEIPFAQDSHYISLHAPVGEGLIFRGRDFVHRRPCCLGRKQRSLVTQTQNGKVVLDEYEEDAVAKSNSNWWLLLEGNIIWLMMVARRISWMPSKLPLWWCGALQTVKLDAEDQTNHIVSAHRCDHSHDILCQIFCWRLQVCKSATP